VKDREDPTIYIVGDIDDPFVPYKTEDLLYNVERDRESIDIFLDKLTQMHSESDQRKLNNPIR
jgi:hypothetical protein